MKANYLRRWCRPRMILVISNRSENPAHTLEVVTRIRATRAKVYLVQLPGPVNTMRGSVHDFPFLVTDTRTTAEEQSVNGARQAFLWAEILSEVTVVKNTPIERIPASCRLARRRTRGVYHTGGWPDAISQREWFRDRSVRLAAGSHPDFRPAHEYERVDRHGFPTGFFCRSRLDPTSDSNCDSRADLRGDITGG